MQKVFFVIQNTNIFVFKPRFKYLLYFSSVNIYSTVAYKCGILQQLVYYYGLHIRYPMKMHY